METLFLDVVQATPVFRGNRIALYFKPDGNLYYKTAYNTEVQLVAVTPAFTTADVKLTLKTVADAGWVMCNDGTIGNATSGATSRANADTEDLFIYLWNNIDNMYAVVSGGRGLSAIADFDANKTIALTKMLGRAIAIAGAGSGLTNRALGLILGQETVSLTEAQNGVHTHIQNAHTHTQDIHGHNVAQGSGVGSTGAQDANFTHTIATSGTTATNQNTTATNQNSGAGSPHENMPPETFLNAMIKL